MDKTEWELLTEVANASNTGEESKLYQIITCNDFSNKPMATSAALFAIELIPESVERNKNALLQFANNVQGVSKDVREAMRYEMLKSLLDLG